MPTPASLQIPPRRLSWERSFWTKMDPWPPTDAVHHPLFRNQWSSDSRSSSKTMKRFPSRFNRWMTLWNWPLRVMKMYSGCVVTTLPLSIDTLSGYMSIPLFCICFTTDKSACRCDLTKSTIKSTIKAILQLAITPLPSKRLRGRPRRKGNQSTDWTIWVTTQVGTD